MSISFRLSIFLVCYLPFLTTAMAQSLNSGDIDRISKPSPTNVAGREVVDSNERRINYLLEMPGVDLATKGTGGATNLIVSELTDSRYSYPLKTIANLSTTSESTPGAVIETWRTGVMGNGLGVAGVIVADIDGDGTAEVISAGSSSTFGSDRFWYELEYHAATQDYQMSWISSPEDSGINVLTTIDVGTEGHC